VQEPQFGEEAKCVLFREAVGLDFPEPLPSSKSRDDGSHSQIRPSSPCFRTDVSGNCSERHSKFIRQADKIEIIRRFTTLDLMAGHGYPQATSDRWRSLGPVRNPQQQVPLTLVVDRNPGIVAGDWSSFQVMRIIRRCK
jgi:hypothetical protein